jgi:hypothetical protein
VVVVVVAAAVVLLVVVVVVVVVVTVLCCRAYDFFVHLRLVSPLIMARKELFYRKYTIFGCWTSVWKLVVLWSIPDFTEPQ